MSLIYLIFMNKTSSFQTTPVTEESLRDYHNLITTFFKCHSVHLSMKINTIFLQRKTYLFQNNVLLLGGSIYKSCKYAFMKHFIDFYNYNYD